MRKTEALLLALLPLAVHCPAAAAQHRTTGCCGNGTIALNREAPFVKGADNFLAQLQTAVRINDRRAVASLVSYPLPVNFGKHHWIVFSEQDLIDHFDRTFTAPVQQSILDQSAGCLGNGFTGVVIGEAEVSFNRLGDGRFAIIRMDLR